MQDQNAVLEPQVDADASPEDRFANDKSVNTAETIEPVEVETETEEVEEEAESEVDSSPAGEEDPDTETDSLDDPKDEEFSGKVKARIDKLTANFREEQRAKTALKLENEELRKQLSEVPKQEEPLKTLADFGYDESKYGAYILEETGKRAEAAAERVAKGFQDKSSSDERQADFRSREAKFAKEVPKYFEVVYGETDGQRHWQASEVMAREIQLSDMGEKLAFHLASNPDISAEIARLPERETVRRMALLESELLAEKAKAKPKKVSKAPPPPPKIKGSDAGLSKDPADMSDKEFAAWRRKQIAAR